MAKDTQDSGSTGRRLALVIAGTGLLWILATLLGDEYGWSQRTRGLFDILALVGFGYAFWMAIGLWRARKE